MLLARAKLGVFDALTDGPGTAAELAPKLAVSSEGLERLLRALNGPARTWWYAGIERWRCSARDETAAKPDGARTNATASTSRSSAASGAMVSAGVLAMPVATSCAMPRMVTHLTR